MTLIAIMNYFPIVDYNDSNLMNEYYTSYKNKINPYKDNYEYPIEYFDKLHYLRHKLHNEFEYSLLYIFNDILGKNGSNILKDELTNYIEQLKIEQDQLRLIQFAISIEQEQLNKDLESMQLNSDTSTDNLESLFTNVNLNNKIKRKNQFFNK